MKNSTLIVATVAMLLVPATGMAQFSKAQTMQVKKVQMALEKVFGKKDKVKKADEIEADLQPGTVKSYKYNNGSYSYEMTTNYTYNTLGNVVTEKQWSDENGMVQILANEYDNVEPDFVTKTTATIYETPASTTPYSETVELRRDVTRNDKGQVTQVENWTANDTNTGLELDSKVTFEYGADGKANKISTTEYDSEEGDMTITMNNIVWEEYNGDLLSIFGSDNLDNIFMEPDNLLKSADLEMTLDDMTVIGSATGTYTDNKSELTMSFYMFGMSVMDMTISMETTDDNGSFVSNITTSSMGESADLVSTEVVCNDKGDVVKNTSYSGTGDARKIVESNEYEYSYNSTTGLIDYTIVSDYDTDTKAYQPLYKLEYSDYVDVTGINGVAANTADGKTAVYNMQGMCVGNSLHNQPSGMYIMKQGGKSVKVIK